jgi:hypothetical protein
MGDKTKARHFVNQYEDSFGDYGITDESDQNLVNLALQLIGNNMHLNFNPGNEAEAVNSQI